MRNHSYLVIYSDIEKKKVVYSIAVKVHKEFALKHITNIYFTYQTWISRHCRRIVSNGTVNIEVNRLHVTFPVDCFDVISLMLTLDALVGSVSQCCLRKNFHCFMHPRLETQLKEDSV